MTGHDPLCPINPPRMDDGFCIWCEVIAKARDNQRGFDIRQQIAERDNFRAKVLAVDPVEWALAGMDAPRIVLAILDGTVVVE